MSLDRLLAEAERRESEAKVFLTESRDELKTIDPAVSEIQLLQEPVSMFSDPSRFQTLSNPKFDYFLDRLFERTSDSTQIKQSISNCQKQVEASYNETISGLRKKITRLKQKQKQSQNEASSVFHSRGQMESLFQNAVQDV